MRIRKRPSAPPSLAASASFPRLHDGITTVLDAAILLETHPVRNEPGIRRSFPGDDDGVEASMAAQRLLLAASTADEAASPRLPFFPQQQRPSHISAPSSSYARPALQHASASTTAAAMARVPLNGGISNVMRTEGRDDIGGYGVRCAAVKESACLMRNSCSVQPHGLGHGPGNTTIRNFGSVCKGESFRGSHAGIQQESNGHGSAADLDRNGHGSSTPVSMAKLQSADQGRRLAPEDSMAKPLRSDADQQQDLVEASMAKSQQRQPEVSAMAPKLHSDQGFAVISGAKQARHEASAMGKQVWRLDQTGGVAAEFEGSMADRTRASQKVLPLQLVLDSRTVGQRHGVRVLQEGGAREGGESSSSSSEKPGCGGAAVVHGHGPYDHDGDCGAASSPSSSVQDRRRHGGNIKRAPSSEESADQAAATTAGEGKPIIITPAPVAHANHSCRSANIMDVEDVTRRLLSSLRGHKRQRSVLACPPEPTSRMRHNWMEPHKIDVEDTVGDDDPLSSDPSDNSSRVKKQRRTSATTNGVDARGKVNGRMLLPRQVRSAANAAGRDSEVEASRRMGPWCNVDATEAEQEQSIKRCKRKDGKGWQCKKPITAGSEYCAYHATKMQKLFRVPPPPTDAAATESSSVNVIAAAASLPLPNCSSQRQYGLVLVANHPSELGSHIRPAPPPTVAQLAADHRRRRSHSSQNSTNESSGGGVAAAQEDWGDSEEDSDSAAPASMRRWRKKCKPCMRKLDDIVNQMQASKAAAATVVVRPPSAIRRSSRLTSRRSNRRGARVQHPQPSDSAAVARRDHHHRRAMASQSSTPNSSDSKPRMRDNRGLSEGGGGAVAAEDLVEVLQQGYKAEANLQEQLQQVATTSSGGTAEVVVDLGGEDHQQESILRVAAYSTDEMTPVGGELGTVAGGSWRRPRDGDDTGGGGNRDEDRSDGLLRRGNGCRTAEWVSEVLPECVVNRNPCEWRTDHFRPTRVP